MMAAESLAAEALAEVRRGADVPAEVISVDLLAAALMVEVKMAAPTAAPTAAMTAAMAAVKMAAGTVVTTAVAR